ncbi:hypothetical protein HK097_001940 [Rhizophlyctis rosea]|uniref:Uncharacterized protein n=1 Tax=Rhizophlyctis rosea TaxID=64517 RepID=A0AAD5SFT7_9FUNG|nr:hypothetical protein HK097_001940 [Rhizophlyctis rosea]
MDVYGFGVRLGVYAENLSGLIFLFLRPDMLVGEAAGTNMFIAAITINLTVQTIQSVPDVQGYIRSMTMLLSALFYPALAMKFTDFLASRGSVTTVLSLLYVALSINMWFAYLGLSGIEVECLELDANSDSPSTTEIWLLLVFSGVALINLIRKTPGMVKQAILYDHLRYCVPSEYSKLGMTSSKIRYLQVVGLFWFAILTMINEYVMWRGGQNQVPYDLNNSGQMLPLVVGVCTLIRTIYMAIIKPLMRPLVYDPGIVGPPELVRQNSNLSILTDVSIHSGTVLVNAAMRMPRSELDT